MKRLMISFMIILVSISAWSTPAADAWRGKLQQVEQLVQKEDPKLFQQIWNAHKWIYDLSGKIREKCLLGPSCENLLRLLSQIRMGYEEPTYTRNMEGNLQIFILPIDLLIGSTRRMAMNSLQEKFIVLDFDTWRQQPTEGRELLFLTEITRFLKFESEEERYRAAGEIYRMIHAPDSQTTDMLTGRMQGNESEMTDRDGQRATVLTQDRKTFVSFSLPGFSGTKLLVMNPKAYIFDKQCIKKEDDWRFMPQWRHDALDIDQFLIEDCMRLMGDKPIPGSRGYIYYLTTRTGNGIVSKCMPSPY